MATTIIACDGESQAWATKGSNPDDPDDATPRCPSCLLTAAKDQLNLSTRVRNDKIIPSTLPAHDIEVDGTDLRCLLVNGDFHVHTPTCPQLKRESDKAKEKPFMVVALDRRDALTQLWSDQIAETDTEDKPDDPSHATDEFLSTHGFDTATDFHSRCLGKTPGFENPKTKKAGSQGKRDARRMLATLMIEAMAAELATILDTNMATGEQDADADRAFILRGMTSAEILTTTSHWVHHLPADKTRWLASGMPAPDRSDWREVPTTTEDIDDAADAETETETEESNEE